MLRKAWDKRGRDHQGPWDTIVVGSGMGGMTCASILSELGEKVLVLEQHYEPGGFTHTFKRPGGYRWDVGVHAIGEVTEHTITGRLLKRLSRGQLEWASLGPVYENFHYPDGFDIQFPDSPQQFRENLVEAFPDEVEAIGRFLDEVREAAGQMQKFYLSRVLPSTVAELTDRFIQSGARPYLERTVDEVLDEITDNPTLKAVLCSHWGYYGAAPQEASFAMQALVTKHFLWGAYYPVGGSQRIAETLLSTVAENGGWTRISTPVDEILLDENGAAAGVQCGDERIMASRVISAIGGQATVRRLLPETPLTREWSASLGDLSPASAHVCLYIGFKGDIRKTGVSAANEWFCSTWDQTIDSWRISPELDEWPEPPILYCSFPSLKDPEHDPGPEQKHTGEAVTFVPWEVFEPWTGTRWKKRPAAYDAFKKRIEDALMKSYLRAMPELEPMIDFVELSTPVTTAHFDRAIGGSIYGLEPTPERFDNPWLRPKSPIKNLYLAGCDVGSPGVMGAMLGGLLATFAARPLAAVDYMVDIV